MHNSLFIKDIIKRVNALPMTRERRDIHRDVFVIPTERKSFETEINKNVKIIADVDPICNKVLGEDFADFLKRMGISATLETGESKKSVSAKEAEIQSYSATRTDFSISPSVKNIEFVWFEDFALRDFSVRIDYDKITVTCGGIEGAWAALADIEHKLKERKAPILKMEEYFKTARWDHQISQGPWNCNYSVPDFDEDVLDDEAFRTYAHYGVNEMMIYGDILVYADGEVIPELEYPTYKENLEKLKRASERAYKYGVRFAYLPVLPKLLPDHPLFVNHPETKGAVYKINDEKDMVFPCSSSKLIQDFYADVFYKLFKAVPLLAGSTMIVSYESFNHCRVWDEIRAHRTTPCPICGKKSFQEVVKLQLEPVKNAIKKANSEAFVNVWEYSFNGDRLKLYGLLDENKKPNETSDYNITYTVGKDTNLIKDGYDKKVWDYSIESQGPVYDTLRLKKYAKEHNMGLFIKGETGIGLEVLQFPYLTSMQQLAKKWESIKACTPKGVQQSWLFFGMFASRAEELAYWACYENCSIDEYLLKMAKRDFGEENGEAVVKAWEYMSKAVRHLPCLQSPIYYNGPMFFGPSHPFLPKYDKPVKAAGENAATGTKHADESVPEIFNAKLFYLMEDQETFSKATVFDISLKLALTELEGSLENYFIHPHDGNYNNWNILIDEFETASKWAKKALDIFEDMKVADPLAFHLTDDKNITELFYRTMVTSKNLYKYFVARDIEKTDYTDILKEERENAVKALKIYKEAPYLNLCERIDGYYSSCIDMINEKIKIIDEIISL